MNYLLIARFAEFDVDDEELFGSSWIVGKATTGTEAVDLAKKGINDFINDQIANRFDLDEEDASEEEKEEIEDFRKSYKVSIIKKLTSTKVDEINTIACLSKEGGNYYQTLEIDIVQL